MAINITMDGHLYEGVEAISVGGKTLYLAWTEDNAGEEESGGNNAGDNVVSGISYSVTYALNRVSSSNPAETVNAGEAYAAILTPESGYELKTVSVTMGGVDVTGTVCSGGSISIGAVTGNLVISASAQMIEVEVPSGIPEDAVLLAGITSDGNQYINTGIGITPYMAIRSVWDIPASPGADKYLYGGKVANVNRTYACLYSGTQVYFGFCCTKANQKTLNTSVYGQENVEIVTGNAYENDNNNVWYKPHTLQYGGNSQTISAEWQAAPASDPVALYLFAENNGGTADGMITATLKAFEIYADETMTSLVMNLVPVRSGDGVVCLYDTVGCKYLYNSGSGAFSGVEV